MFQKYIFRNIYSDYLRTVVRKHSTNYVHNDYERPFVKYARHMRLRRGCLRTAVRKPSGICGGIIGQYIQSSVPRVGVGVCERRSSSAWDTQHLKCKKELMFEGDAFKYWFPSFVLHWIPSKRIFHSPSWP